VITNKNNNNNKYTWKITHNIHSTAVWWGSPMVKVPRRKGLLQEKTRRRQQ